jgi:HD-GYP domain-containing protein (c-di-GMP phosphodiesterase class II)
MFNSTNSDTHFPICDADVRQRLQRIFGPAISMLSAYDHSTEVHSYRVAGYARLLAEAVATPYGVGLQFIDHLTLSVPLHDLGKTRVPREILDKPGRLTAAEIEIIRRHVEYGLEMFRSLTRHESGLGPQFTMARNIIAFHHENVAGDGYPFGLVGDSIPLEAKITAIADVFDALTSVRPYKRAWSNDEAMEELHTLAGHKFDAFCVAAFAQRLDDIVALQQEFSGQDWSEADFVEILDVKSAAAAVEKLNVVQWVPG